MRILPIAAVLCVIATRAFAMSGDQTGPSARNAAQRQENYRANVLVFQKREKEQAPAVLRKNEQILNNYWMALQDDIASFQFNVKRWGDYLEISMMRGGKSYAVALLISDLSPARIEAGHAPDLNGSMGFTPTVNGNGPDIMGANGYLDYGFDGDPKKGTITFSDPIDPNAIGALPQYPPDQPLPFQFSNITNPSDASRTCYSGGTAYSPTYFGTSGNYICTDNTPPFISVDAGDKWTSTGQPMARAAKDDEIVLGTRGMIIYTPFGLGRVALEKLMTATGNDTAKHK